MTLMRVAIFTCGVPSVPFSNHVAGSLAALPAVADAGLYPGVFDMRHR